jgi:hypothetical protein
MAIIRQSLTETANTFSQNQTLNGTANTAPNQTAASASSLMTRSLAGTEPFFNLGACYRPASLAFGNAGAGSSAITFQGSNTQAWIGSGTTATGYGRVSLTNGFGTHPTNMSGGGITFNRQIGVAVRLFFSLPNLNSLTRMVVGGNAGVPATADQNALSARGFGWEVRRNGTPYEVRLFAHNGTTYSTSSWQSLETATASSDWLYNAVYISVVSNGAGLITCFHGLNGNRNLSSFTLSGGPQLPSAFANNSADLVVVNTTTPLNGSVALTDTMLICNA